MDAPALVLVPPSPLKLHSVSPTPSLTSSTTTASSYPPKSRFSGVQQRQSSETTIFSIYSMYGDDHSSTNWSAATPVTVDRKSSSVDANIPPTLNITLPDTPLSNDPDDRLGSELAYYGTDDLDMPPESQLVKAITAKPAHPPPINGASYARRSLLRPSSSHVPPASFVHPAGAPDARRASNGYSIRHSAKPSLQSIASSQHPSSRSSRTSRSSQALYERNSDLIDRDRELRDLPPLPPSNPSSRYTTPSSTPERQPSPAHNLPGPSSKASSKRLHASPSKLALVPSEGEDMDAFHVRSTYARLEMSGVKGDGYEEGVERTRARVGNSRASQLNAEASIGDGTERSRELDPKEIMTLSSLDRYGFYSVPSHDRLVLVSSAPLLRRIAPTSAGSLTTPAVPPTLKVLPPTPASSKEMSRIFKWTRMLKPLVRDRGANIASWGVKPSKEGKLRSRTYKGIPDSWRGAAWEMLMSRYSKRDSRALAQLSAEYNSVLDKPSTYDIQIDLDVPRTINGHVMFRTRYGAGQRSLFHVLHCFSLRCKTCGYVQGMGPIAATFLCYFEPERVYAALVLLHDAYSLHSVFNPGFPGLREAIYVQERITQQLMPDVYAAFKKHMISTTSYATKWYITLFANSVPFQTQLRFWDAFLLEGYDVFIAVAVAIVWVFRDHITSSSANFETILSLLSSFFVAEDEDALLSWISKLLGDKKMRLKMHAWKADWNRLVASGNDAAALL